MGSAPSNEDNTISFLPLDMKVMGGKKRHRSGKKKETAVSGQLSRQS